MKVLLLALISALITNVCGHGFLSSPRSRNKRARDLGLDYCPHCKNGNGQINVLAADPDGVWNYPETPESAVRHGLCGDGAPGSNPQTLMYGGSLYGAGEIEETYRQGQSIEISIWVDTHHHGWFEFYLCNKDDLENPNGPITQECLSLHQLVRDPNDPSESPIHPSYPGRYYMYPRCHDTLDEDGKGYLNMKYTLPGNVACEHCVLQWWWVTANSCNAGGYEDPDIFPNTYTDCIGDGGSVGWLPNPSFGNCADQVAYPEEFWNCADIKISPSGSPPIMSTTSTPTPAPVAATGKPVVENPTPLPTLLPSSKGEGCGALWDSCGGASHTSRPCCNAEDECVFVNEWYSQCQPARNGGDQTTFPPVTSSPTSLTESFEGIAQTTRYWDCCKPSCSWESNTGNTLSDKKTVKSCTIDGDAADPNSKNVCSGGGGEGIAYMCTDQQPFEQNGILYGFAASNVDCCGCYELEFLSYSVDSNGNNCSPGCSSYAGQLLGKRMIVQVTNKGGDLSKNHFDIQMPGGGFGLFNGCADNGNEPVNGPPQFSTPYSNWGERYGGFSSSNECSSLPTSLQTGCEFRLSSQGFYNSDNPGVKFKRVQCPTSLTDKTGCILADDKEQPLPLDTSPTPLITAAPTTKVMPEPTLEPTTQKTNVPTISRPTNSPSSTSPPFSQTPCADLYEQCGGKGWSGPKCCSEGTICTDENPYYSQCVPDTTRTCQLKWEQCSSSMPCCNSYTCVYQNPNYSQCL